MSPSSFGTPEEAKLLIKPYRQWFVGISFVITRRVCLPGTAK